MNQEENHEDEMLPEYDFSGGVRGKHYKKSAPQSNVEMMNKKLEELGGLQKEGLVSRAATEEDVSYVEQHIGSRLPEGYRFFLLQYGSEKAYFNELVGFAIETYPDGVCCIDTFIGAVPVETHYCYDLVSHRKEIEGYLPNNILPVADDGAGNYVCLSVAGDDAGQVYFWNHEEVRGIEEEPSCKNMEFVASSFTDFITKLQIYNGK